MVPRNASYVEVPEARSFRGGRFTYLLAGASKELGLHSQTLQSISREYVKARTQFRKLKLKWRSRFSLGWIPFKSSGVRLVRDSVFYAGQAFRFWKSREIEGKIKEGSFNQDSRGRWYVNFQCEVSDQESHGESEVGIDLGCKDTVVCSNGRKFSRENLTRKYQEKLAKVQRARKKKQTKNIHAKIQNQRKDFAHKTTTEICRTSKLVIVGDINSKGLAKTRMAKSIYDAGFAQIKMMLGYKAIRHGIVYKEVSEAGSTISCSNCSARSGPSGLRGLAVREWSCSECGAYHDRDINAARNILRMGHHALLRNPLPLSEPLRRA